MPFFPNDMTPMIFTLSILSFAAIIVIAIIAAGVMKHRREIEVHKAAIDKGLAPGDLNLGKPPEATLRSGLVWIAIGVGLFIVILAASGTRSLAVSAIPILIGIALIVSYRLEKK